MFYIVFIPRKILRYYLIICTIHW